MPWSLLYGTIVVNDQLQTLNVWQFLKVLKIFIFHQKCKFLLLPWLPKLVEPLLITQNWKDNLNILWWKMRKFLFSSCLTVYWNKTKLFSKSLSWYWTILNWIGIPMELSPAPKFYKPGDIVKVVVQYLIKQLLF